MSTMLDLPLVAATVILIALWVAVVVGNYLQRLRPLATEERDDFNIILSATLTLLFLIIGFSFSLAAGRYDMRKQLEEAEANAIGTEYTRADLLPPADAAKVRALLTTYLGERIQYYQTRDARQLAKIEAATSQTQSELWSTARAPAEARPSAMTALVLSGMNDVINSQGYTEAAWLNRIPPAAWILMIFIAISSNVLVGFGLSREKRGRMVFLILPVIMSVAFFLIADIDSPRSGIIRVNSVNLLSLSRLLNHNQPG